MSIINNLLNSKLDNESIYLVGFRGRGIVSNLIKFVEHLFFAYSEYTHIGILIHSSQLCSDIKMENCILNNEWICFESTLSGKYNDNINNSCNKTFFGIQARNFKDIIEIYNGQEGYFCVGKLLVNSKPFNLNNNLKKYLKKKYDYNIFNLFTINIIEKHNVDKILLFFSIKPTEKRFCSDFVFAFLKDCNLIPDKFLNYHSKNISPSFLINNIIHKKFIFISKPH